MNERLPNVLQKLEAANYAPMFEAAFGSPEITAERMLNAFAQFQLMCISADSPYDKYLQGDENALNYMQLQGLEVFEQKCSSCHSGMLFTNNEFINNGLPITNFADKGHMQITGNPANEYTFKVPSLRNVASTFPYMHDGRFTSLREVLEHYSSGIEPTATTAEQLRQGISLTTNEKLQLLAFLQSLTDEAFINNKDLSEF
jgi:cytochrome c peroxidase